MAIIERIVLVGDHGRKDYKFPVPVNSDKKDKLEVTVSTYRRIGQEEGGHYPKLLFNLKSDNIFS